ncbi:MAG: FAD-binding oxidoreductase [bacterium]
MTFQATLIKSGRKFSISEQSNVLKSALDSGVLLPHSCKSGQCGSCKARLISGEINYPDGTPPGLSSEDVSNQLILLCQAVPQGPIEIDIKELAVSAYSEPRILPVRVVESNRLTTDVMQLFLALPKGQKLDFQAGQYIDVLLKGGKRRAFSLANAPDDSGLLELHIRHVDGGDFTGWVFDQMKERALLRIEAPLGAFFLQTEPDKNIILAGGGTGFAPLKGMIEQLIAENNTQEVQLFWGTRSEQDLYWHDKLLDWQDQYSWLSYTPVISETNSAWKGQTGWVHDAIVSNNSDLSNSQVYMSGPPAMINAAKETLFSAGLNSGSLYYDAFEFASDVPVSNKEVI